MAKYRKKPVPTKIELVTEARTIKTLEGSQDVAPGQYLATGEDGEQYAFDREVFDTYEPIEGRDGYYTKRADILVEAARMAYAVEIFRPGWVHKGKAGDWLITRTPEDQHICDAEVFAKSYEPVDDPELITPA